MPSVRLTQRALRDLERMRPFLQPKNAASAKKASTKIIQTIQMLSNQPDMGRPVEDLHQGLRELIVKFGRDGYVVLYRYIGDEVLIAAIRHGREDGYK
ncbi:type II toxin-antitoxin system RelE/ParE family toxin [Agrobacterium rhizogenes]|nr:type II toxin-antitoxin system RelE/ParE family toxin [Rhizobium rhizogenes]OCJ21401.1 plasmid stabilization protein [Agrobacterium sp. B131/95]NTG12307.1 type II toxin-antitoxin system RelE/ParE family toxin [Rhizobium rhizogenes]NTG18988.1 type II toxin-antitoxin system RelE/ParE family toxin [Rhizobium rhizogenes]NTG25712.1 type II toxin-antitoxin system RelE/ParE family toxin [Rhizobium rhizogenes]